MKKVKAFLINTLILTASALLMRTIGVAYNAYLSQKIGEAGMGLYQLILSVYMLAVTFASSGIRLAATRLTVEEFTTTHTPGKVMRVCLLYSSLFGLLSAAALWNSAEWIGIHWLGDLRPVLSLKLLAFSLPFLSIAAALGGYFTGAKKIGRLASIQLFEQLAFVLTVSCLLPLFLSRGLEYACAAIVSGSVVSEALSCLLLYALYRLDMCRVKGSTGAARPFRRLLHIALPDAISSYVRSGLLTLEHLLIPAGFRKSGASAEASLAAYGVLHGMVLPVVLYPAALLNALANMLVPEISESHALQNNKRTHYMISRVLQMTLLFSLGVAGFFSGFSSEISFAVYGKEETAPFIALLAPLVPFMYLDTAVDGMLRGLGEQVSSMRYNIIDSLVSVVLVYTLLPRLAVKGYIIMLFFSEILNFALSIHRLNVVSGFDLPIWKAVIKPLLCIVGSVAVARLFPRCVALPALSPAGRLLLFLGMTLFVYAFSLWLCACISKDDLRWFCSIFRGKKGRGKRLLP